MKIVTSVHLWWLDWKIYWSNLSVWKNIKYITQSRKLLPKLSINDQCSNKPGPASWYYFNSTFSTSPFKCNFILQFWDNRQGNMSLSSPFYLIGFSIYAYNCQTARLDKLCFATEEVLGAGWSVSLEEACSVEQVSRNLAVTYLACIGLHCTMVM